MNVTVSGKRPPDAEGSPRVRVYLYHMKADLINSDWISNRMRELKSLKQKQWRNQEGVHDGI